MSLTRRHFLAGTGAAIAAVCGHSFLYNREVQPAPVKERKVLCDLHAHPAKYKPIEELERALLSPGLVGLTHINTTKRNLTYEDWKEWYSANPNFNEITRGQLAQYQSSDHLSYFARTQEVTGGIHDLLAVGWEGDYFPDFKDGRRAVEEIHKKKGLAVLAHPYVIKGGLMFRLAREEEIPQIEELAQMVDALEVHNAQNIDLVPGIAFMQKADVLAGELAQKYDKSGIASSDAHRRVEQVKICGIYLDEHILEGGMGWLKGAVKSGAFEVYGDASGPYVSRMSWLKGMVLEQRFGGRFSSSPNGYRSDLLPYHSH